MVIPIKTLYTKHKTEAGSFKTEGMSPHVSVLIPPHLHSRSSLFWPNSSHQIFSLIANDSAFSCVFSLCGSTLMMLPACTHKPASPTVHVVIHFTHIYRFHRCYTRNNAWQVYCYRKAINNGIAWCSPTGSGVSVTTPKSIIFQTRNVTKCLIPLKAQQFVGANDVVSCFFYPFIIMNELLL